MSKFLPLLAFGMLLHAQDSVEGDWQGTIQIGVNKLRLQLHIVQDASGKLGSKLDSLDQGAMGIPVPVTKFQKGKLHLEAPVIQATYDGHLNADGSEIDGTFWQGDTAFKLKLARATKSAELKRPQTPKPPFPYDSIEVSYANGDAKLAGTLTVPHGSKPFPCALLITGSGPQDRDETLLGHKPFWIIADHLSRHGIAVLRLDDRGVGKSTGSSTDTTMQEMAQDVLAGVAFLKTRKEIDPAKIGLIGHSEGGIVGPLAASQSADVAFVVMLAGPGVTGEKILYLQGELIARAMGAPEAAIAQNRKIQELIFNVMRDEQKNDDRQAVIAKLREAWKAKFGADAPKQLDGEFNRVTSPELRSFLFYDPADAIKKMKAPLLALNGSRDQQVPASQNLPAILAAAKSGGSQDVTTTELPDLNHLFQHCKSCGPSEYANIEETFAPEALDTMTEWIVKRTRN